jgi:intracellular multiplication protein IcmT
MDTHWRNSMKPARFFFMDARAAVPFVFAMLHLRWYTMVFAGITTLIFYFLEQRGLSFVAALRAFRVWLVTRKRPAVRHSDITRMVDFAFEKLPEEGANQSTAAAAAGRESGRTAQGQARQRSGQPMKKTIQPAAPPQARKTVAPRKRPPA